MLLCRINDIRCVVFGADLVERRLQMSRKCPSWAGQCPKFHQVVLLVCTIRDDPGGRVLLGGDGFVKFDGKALHLIVNMSGLFS